jgi:UrcA family protein
MKTLALALSVAVTATAYAAPGLASSGEATSVQVRVSDLDLASDAGVTTLYTRIRRAARKACRDAESPSAARQVEHKLCMRTAMDSGVVAANNDALSALHLAETGRTPATVAAK